MPLFASRRINLIRMEDTQVGVARGDRVKWSHGGRIYRQRPAQGPGVTETPASPHTVSFAAKIAERLLPA